MANEQTVSVGGLEFTRDEILDRVASKIAKGLDVETYEEDGEDGSFSSLIERTGTRLRSEAVKNQAAAIEKAVQKICEEIQVPMFEEAIRKIVLQKTDRWGEKVGQPQSFLDFIVATAENYMTEQVNVCGKTKSQDSYNWSGHSSRLDHAINSHIQFHIERAMKAVISRAHEILGKSLEETVKVKMAEITSRLKVEVKV